MTIHIKTSNKLPYSPISMRVAEYLFEHLNQGKSALFNLNTHKVAANTNEWRVAA